ncbi:MAG: AAA family ATPase [Chelatococcus sp.]|uniref:AAA family ATPase n=1 Tax=Chelatococcus sp. TaxID=1953771 RepID=UPI0025BA0E24|nr:AAA family ATPase [Chelatococcus sp.]MBX3537671.1 AAA family ATPase [Chelatococcus sp.]
MSAVPLRDIEREDERPRRSLPLTFFHEVEAVAHKPWLIKGVIARGEVSGWIGPPGTLKSALLTDLSIHLSAGMDWRGHRCKSDAGVIMLALERADLTRRRLAAYAVRDGYRELPIAVAGQIIDLMSPECVDQIVATIDDARAEMKIDIGLMIIDTWAKGIAAGGGDEDKAKDQSRALANCRRELRPIHLAIVGHTGKDESRGARGSNAFLGDVDLQVSISGSQVKTATITKANDQPEGPLVSFSGEVISFGNDEDGDEITAFILSADNQEPEAKPATAKRPDRLPPATRIAFDALAQAIDEVGRHPPASNHVPPKVLVVTVDEWRTYAYKRSISNGEARARQQAFQRAADRLVSDGLVSVWGDYAWMVVKR